MRLLGCLSRPATLLALAAFLAAILAASAAPAAASPLYDIKARWGDTNLPPGGRGLLEPGSLLRFDSTGKAQNFTAAPAHPGSAAVNPVNGDLYVIDIASAGGATLRTYTPAGTETGTPCPLEWAANTPLPQPGVDAAGDLYYPNTQTGAVQKLEPECTEVPLAHPVGSLTNPNSVALDAAGDIYVVDGTNKGTEIASGRVQKFAPDGTPIETFQSGEVTAVAVDKSTGDVFVGRGWGSSFHIGRYSSTGTLLKNFGTGKFATQSASEYPYNQLALNEATKTVYAADPASPAALPGEVEVFKVGGGGAYVLSTPLPTGKLTAAVAVNQASGDVYAASAGQLNNLGQFEIQARNVSTETGSAFLLIADQLPAGVTATAAHWFYGTELAPSHCHGDGPGPAPHFLGASTVICEVPASELEALKASGRGTKEEEIASAAPTGYLPSIGITVQVEPRPEGTAANKATVTSPATPATTSEGGGGSNEVQTVTVKAAAGQFKLAPATATGTGTLAEGEKVITAVSATLGTFRVGDAISAPGIPATATIASVGSGTLTISKAATASGTRALIARETTGNIEWNASPGSVQAALAALPGIGAGNVAVSGGPGDEGGEHPYVLAFGGSLADKNLPQMATVDGATPLSGGAPDFSDEDQVTFSATPAPFGLVPGSFEADFLSAEYPAGEPARKAGAHPFEFRFNFDLNARTEAPLSLVEGEYPKLISVAPLKTVEATLPHGAIGNPEAIPKCDPVDFASTGAVANSTACPANTQVGYINILLPRGAGAAKISNALLSRVPVYSLKPPRGQVADFAFNASGLVQGHIYPVLDPAQDYAIKTVTPDISNLIVPSGAEVTFWGVPADPAHDLHRYYSTKQPGEIVAGAPFKGAIRPFFTDPMDCGEENGGTRVQVESYMDPGVLTPVQKYGSPDNVTGCNDPRFRFEPKIALQPTDRHAGAPTGLDIHLEVPQRNDEVAEAKELYAESSAVEAIATPPLKKAVVTFPEGMTLNPSAAQGLGSCTLAQISLDTNDPVTCPDNSQYGTLTIHTPLLPTTEPMEGFIYIARQNDNPFHNFLSLYLVIELPERGILVKIPGKVELNESTGQITTSFEELPQFPVSDMQMSLKGGVSAGLVEPSTCGQKTITAEFFTWQDPKTPHVKEDSYKITQRPDGRPCVNSLGERPFKPQLQAGTENNRAGSYSPFSLELTRTDEDQEFSQLGLTLPPGLAARFAGVGICPESGIAQAISRTKAGNGALEQTDPSCPASSQIGTTQVGTGVGVPLTYVPGKVYLAAPYNGAPISIVVITPAVVGPFDLGVIAVQAALNVNPETAQGQATTDPFPQIFQGIPVRIRDIRVNLDRKDFTLNPTSCAEMQIAAHITGTGGNVNTTVDDTAADLSNRFQAADCASLGFKPRLSFRLFGATHRGAHPKLRAVLKARPGDANIAAAVVTLPHSEFLDQSHIRTICTRVQFAAKACPEGSIYGHAEAITPLFDQPLSGPVYLRSSSHDLPDLVAVLRGPDAQPVEVDLDGRIDSVHGGIRNSFEVVPDAPVTKFTLSMQGGKKGLLQNSTDLCASTHRATARFIAQNGKKVTLKPAMRNGCGGHARKHKRSKRRQRA